jgi:uncharacterized lipoprotein YmbA
MSRKTALALLALVAMVMLATSGCGGSKPSRFYLLQSASMEQKAVTGGTMDEIVLIGILPMEMPDYLMRPQIATRLEGNRLDYAEYDRWAEPIQDNVKRLVKADIDRALAGFLIVEYPWPPNLDVQYRLNLKIEQFDLYADGSAVLAASWAIGKGRKGPWIRFDTINLTETFEEDKKADYGARVAALNRLVTAMNRRLADHLKTFIDGEPSR